MPLVLMLFVQACQYDPHAHLYTTRKPSKADVVGRYVLGRVDLNNRDAVKGMASKTCVLDLKADGTFVATDVPAFALDVSGLDVVSRLVNGSGTWSIDAIGSVDNGDERDARPIWGVSLRSSDAPHQKVESPTFTGQTPPYGLIFVLGDPDSGEALLLEKAA